MKVKVAVIQESPVFFDLSGTLDKVEKLVATYAAQGCELLVFPESFIPGYPRGFSFGTTIGSRTEEGRRLFAEYAENSLDLKGSALKRLEKVAKHHGTYLVMGATERQHAHGTLFCSMLYISPTQGLLGVHRKIKPTGTERVVWGEATGDSLVTFETKIGKLGGLICWENYMPLARMSMYQKGIEIYIAPTADSRAQWISTLQHIALEGRCFVLGCNQFFTKSMYPPKFRHLVDDEPEECCPGGSLIVSPLGQILEGPLFGQAGALVTELDLNAVQQSKLDFDVIGHYARNDIFTLNVNGQPETKKE